METLRRHVWWVYGLLFCGILAFDITQHKIDSNFDPSTFIGTMTPVVLIPLGIWLHRPQWKLPWLFWWVGHVMLSIALILGFAKVQKGVTPSFADLFYILQWPYLAMAVVLMCWRRERRRDILAMLGAIIIVLGISAFTFWGTIHAVEGSTLYQIQQYGYIIVELLFLVAAIRLLWSPGNGGVSYWLIIIMALVVSASSFIEGEMQGILRDGDVPKFDSPEFILLRYVPTMALYAMAAIVALHPSMARISDYANPGPFRWRWKYEFCIAVAVFGPLIVTTYHGVDNLLRITGWFCVLLLISRYWIMHWMFKLMRQKLTEQIRNGGPPSGIDNLISPTNQEDNLRDAVRKGH